MLTVYHGSTYRVEQPLAGVCRPNLDFGVGFYLTDLKEQAVRWALRTADIRHENSVWLNIYSLDIDACRNFSFERDGKGKSITSTKCKCSSITFWFVIQI